MTRAKAVTGSLPTHVTVEEYAARWLRTYDAKPVNTRIFHTRNLGVVTAALGSSQLAKVVPTDITVMLNRVIETKGAAYAARVYCKGEWYSYYDGATWTQASDVDIDHMVPLAEAWDSGARTWNADTRQRFANDLDDDRSLVAVTDNVNRSKSDRDPAEWLPTYEVCRYVEEWTAVRPVGR